MKKKSIIMLLLLIATAILLIAFSSRARLGAAEGLALAENTIIPSLAPLLIIFLLIMKTEAKDVLAKCFGFVSTYFFNLPMITFPAIFLGLVGGYPTGALLTEELLINGEIDNEQAKRLLRFNFCGGCGFIITAVGSATLNNTKAGLILYFSNLASSIIIGFILSFNSKRAAGGYYSYTEHKNIGDCLTDACNSAVKSILNITAFIILFSAFAKIIYIPDSIMPLIEITNGICNESSLSLALISAYLSFGGLCIHFQILPIIARAKMNYADFFIFRVISALLSYCITKIALLIFPIDVSVFSNADSVTTQAYSVNIALSILMIIGSGVIILDISSKKKFI